MAVKSYKNSKEKSQALRKVHDDYVSEYDLKRAEEALKNTPSSMEINDSRTMLRVALEKVQAHNAKLKKMATRIEKTPVKA